MLYLTILSVCLLAATCQAKASQKHWYHTEDAEQHFEEFIATYNKQYKDESEKNMRFLIFKENLMIFNEKNSMGHAKYGITKFADLAKEEIKQLSHGLLPLVNDKITRADLSGYTGREPVPESFDWRDKGKVTSVKAQGECESGWAFSSIGTVEGQYAIKYDKLVELSVQQLVDCDKEEGGCNGGRFGAPINWLAVNGGSMTEEDYPYTGLEETCKADKSKTVAEVTSSVGFLFNEDEDYLKELLIFYGPLAVAIDSTPLYGYLNGIITCEPDNVDINHSVLLVGYGKEDDKPYWLLKNSWNTTFGEEGYFRLEMYKNSCNIASHVGSAIIA